MLSRSILRVQKNLLYANGPNLTSGRSICHCRYRPCAAVGSSGRPDILGQRLAAFRHAKCVADQAQRLKRVIEPAVDQNVEVPVCS